MSGRHLGRLRAGLAAAALAASACATPATAPGSDPRPAWSGLGRDFFVRQQVVARVEAGDTVEERGFEIALQSRCGELRVVGLTGFGVRLFTAVRSADGLQVDTLGAQELPFPPERVLRDVERTFFFSAPPDAGATAGPGLVERVVRHAGESVAETWQAGRLVARRIAVAERPGAPPLEIRYEGAVRPPGIAERVRLSNPAFGYVLDIRNHHVEELSCVPSP